MKKIITLLVIISAVIVSSAQTRMAPTTIDVDGVIGTPQYYYWEMPAMIDTIADTLTLRIKGNYCYNINCQLYLNVDSATTVADTAFFLRSIDGSTWASTGDTLTSASTTSSLLSTVVSLNSFNYPYLRVIFKQKATGTSVIPRLYIINRLN